MRGPADQLLIDRDGLVRDAGPGEVLLYPLAAGLPQAPARGRVAEERGGLRAQGCERTDRGPQGIWSPSLRLA